MVRGGRLWTLIGLAVLLVVTMVGRLVQLQVVDGDRLSAAAASLNTRTYSIPAARGRILAADGQALVANGATSVVTVDRAVLADQADGGAALLTRAATLLGVDAGQLAARTKACGTAGALRSPLCFSGSPYQPIPIASDVPADRALTLLERPEDFPGIAVQARPVRTFPAPDGVNAAHLIGYLGSTNRTDLQRDPALTATDTIGRAGLEKQYDDVLRGQPGRTTVAVDPRGLVTRQLSHTDPISGRDLVTHLDPVVQSAAERSLAAGIARARKAGEPADSGAVVVLDATDGAVVAAASAPTYDLSVWSGGITPTDYARLTGPAAPLLDRATVATKPPASTFKGISLPAAIGQGVDPQGSYDCSSSVQIGDRAFHNYESAAYGQISMEKALEISCDTVFYRWSYAAWKAAGGLQAPVTAHDPFADMARSFGLGRRTGIDLPDEASGRIPDRAWKQAHWEATKAGACRRSRGSYPDVKDRARAAYLKAVDTENCTAGYVFRAGDAVNLSIGQGDVAATPLQMAVAYAAVANGGTLWTPQVAAATEVSGGGERTVIAPHRAGTVSFPGSSLAVERAGFAAVTTKGTAKEAFAGFPLTSYPVSGKTGTAEIYGQQPTSWFTSYGPRTASGHQYVVVAMISQGGTGATAAAPTARAVWDVLRTRP